MIITTDYDDHLSNIVESDVVNFTIELLLWAENVRRGYRYGAYHRLQVRSIQSLVLIICPVHTLLISR